MKEHARTALLYTADRMVRLAFAYLAGRAIILGQQHESARIARKALAHFTSSKEKSRDDA